MGICARVLIVCGSAFLLMGTPRLASAQTTFDLTWTGGYGPGTAILTATPDGGDEYTVTAISGDQNGSMISGILSPGGYGGNDNLIYYPGSPNQVDVFGLGFSVGSTDYNLWFYPPGYWECSSDVTLGCGEGNSPQVESLEIDPTPEPGTLLLFASGLLGFLLCRKRFTRVGHVGA